MSRITAIFLYGPTKDVDVGEVIVFKDVIVRGFKLRKRGEQLIAVPGTAEDKISGNLFDYKKAKKFEDQLEQWDVQFKPMCTREVVEVEVFPGRRTKKAWMYLKKEEM